jgi:hypothetical protein
MAPVVGLSIFLGGVFVFKLTDPEWQARLASFRQGNPSDLGDEIALMRLLVEEACNSKHIALAGQLLSGIGRLELIQTQQQHQRGELLDRHALQAAGRAICQSLIERLSSLPNFEAITDLIIPAVMEGISAAGHEPLLLTHEKETPK